MADGAIIKLRRHGNPTGPRIVLSHGNGLAADLYYPFWSLLADRFDIVLYDLRNHGWNPIGDRAAHIFPRLSTTARESTRPSTAISERNPGLACSIPYPRWSPWLIRCGLPGLPPWFF
jgi:pimeloyl-ACP methyl ester carboxylesterase